MRQGLSIPTIAAILLAISFGVLAGGNLPTAFADTESSCVACHTDEKRLIENLSKAKPKKSALTSGAG